ncbi:NADH dehydrogenase [ubiquinone] 1 alpha subcomplex subunit 13-A [Platanthera guangdongensis]|uniref:NADH dehydrogenase [ubiquinone] 1 alpha subcomplex subunit 13 n=1 Tax=Platanthera guangdongensis TaxID=2320717 RepID=A0ABR2MFN5_9ASPA
MTEAAIRKKPGMVSVHDMPILQDGPPAGGFAPVRYARRIPTKGPSAVAMFLAVLGAFSYGMYQVGQGNKIRRYGKTSSLPSVTTTAVCFLIRFVS